MTVGDDAYERLKAERDAAVSRAEAAMQERAALRETIAETIDALRRIREEMERNGTPLPAETTQVVRALQLAHMRGFGDEDVGDERK